MPTSLEDDSYFEFDADSMLAIPGAKKLSNWFGYPTNFHDDTITRCELDGANAKMTILSSRMTSVINDQGHFIQDRHAKVSIHLEQITGLNLKTVFPVVVSELAIRRVAEGAPIPYDTRVEADDFEMAFDNVMGGRGSIYAKALRIEFEPMKVDQ